MVDLEVQVQTKHILTAQLTYVQGATRYGHLELELTEAEFEDFKTMTKQEKEDYFTNNAAVVVDDFDINFVGDHYGIEYNGDPIDKI